MDPISILQQLFERFFRRVKGPRGVAALFIIRYEGHVDLVTAHKPHFEIVETRATAAAVPIYLSLVFCLCLQLCLLLV